MGYPSTRPRAAPPPSTDSLCLRRPGHRDSPLRPPRLPKVRSAAHSDAFFAASSCDRTDVSRRSSHPTQQSVVVREGSMQSSNGFEAAARARRRRLQRGRTRRVRRRLPVFGQAAAPFERHPGGCGEVMTETRRSSSRRTPAPPRAQSQRRVDSRRLRRRRVRNAAPSRSSTTPPSPPPRRAALHRRRSQQSMDDDERWAIAGSTARRSVSSSTTMRPTAGRTSAASSVTNGVGKRAVGPWVQRGGSGVFSVTTDGGGGTLGGDTNPNSKPSVVTFEPSDGSAAPRLFLFFLHR